MRACMGCTACCTVLEVPDLAPRGVDCKHQCADGCSIYPSRPHICRAWQCQWMADNNYAPALLTDDEKPDVIGLMVNVDTVDRIGPVLVVHELREGAAMEHEDVLDRLTGHSTVLVRQFARS